MAQNENSQLLKISLLIFAIVALVYGIGYMFFPQFLVGMSGGEPVGSAWLRWSGGILVSLGIGAILVYQNPAKQGPFVTTIALGTLFTGLALLYALIFEMAGQTWFTALPMIIVLILSALLWYSRQQAKELLSQNTSETEST
ncbi:hypothetical protein ACFLU5_03425 [Bacteroidota bacterium]